MRAFRDKQISLPPFYALTLSLLSDLSPSQIQKLTSQVTDLSKEINITREARNIAELAGSDAQNKLEQCEANFKQVLNRLEACEKELILAETKAAEAWTMVEAGEREQDR